MAAERMASLPPTQRVVEVWVDGLHWSVRAWDTLRGEYRVYADGGAGRADAWWLHATRCTGKEPRDLVRAREAEEKRVSEELLQVSTALRTSSDRLSRLAEKHCDKVEGLDELPSLQDKVRSILNFKTHVEETKVNGNAHLVLILNTKDEIKAKSDISSVFSGLPTYKNMHVNMSRNLANVYFCDTTDAEKFIGKIYPSIRQVRKGHAWDTATIKKTERMIISPDAKDIETMKSLQDEIASIESNIYRQIKPPTPPPAQVAMPPPRAGEKRKYTFMF